MSSSEQATGYQLAVLTAIMGRFSPTSQARQDFQAALAELVDVQLGAANKIRVAADFWDYWSSVATGKSSHYDALGERVAHVTKELK
jgi:hypothetical protein